MEQTTVLLEILGWIAVKVPVIQQIMIGLAALPPILVAMEREIVTPTMIVLDLLFVV